MCLSCLLSGKQSQKMTSRQIIRQLVVFVRITLSQVHLCPGKGSDKVLSH